FYCGAASSNVDDIFVALSASTDKVSQSVEILQFIVAQIVGDGSIKIGSASQWLKLISKNLRLQSHEVQGSNKSNSLDDCVHVLACVFLTTGPINSLSELHLKSLRVVMNAIVHVMFQRFASTSKTATDKNATAPNAQPSAQKINAGKIGTSKRTAIPSSTSSARKRATSKTEAEPKTKRTRSVVRDEDLVGSE
ncbi:hypothetical protein HDU98_006016, partial [Podochytrium sp. JEL0797]